MTYFRYYPKFFDGTDWFESLYSQVIDLCKPVNYNIYGKKFVSKRISCTYTRDFKLGYKDTPMFLIDKAPEEIKKMWTQLESKFGYQLDYVLVHIYDNWDSKINWHNDKEALSSEIFSVSFGTTRRFVLKEHNGQNKTEFKLGHGDLFHMFGPRDNQSSCQEKYIHCIPPMTMRDILYFFNENNIHYSGPKRKQAVQQFLSESNIQPSRINLTFRQFE